MSSIKQIEANRLNAGKSAGTRTTEGKFVVAANPLKHGIFARSPAFAGENSFAFSEAPNWGDNRSALARHLNDLLAVACHRNHSRLTHLQHRVDSADRACRRNLEFLIKLQTARLKVVTPTTPKPEAISQPQSPETSGALASLVPEIGFVPANPISDPTVALKVVTPAAPAPEAISQPQSLRHLSPKLASFLQIRFPTQPSPSRSSRSPLRSPKPFHNPNLPKHLSPKLASFLQIRSPAHRSPARSLRPPLRGPKPCHNPKLRHLALWPALSPKLALFRQTRFPAWPPSSPNTTRPEAFASGTGPTCYAVPAFPAIGI